MKKDILKKETFCGIPVSEAVGIALMLIPFIISIAFNKPEEKMLRIITVSKEINIRPNLLSSLCAGAFYVSLIVRYDFFKTDNFGNIILSIVQTFLNVWVLSSLLSTVIDADNQKVPALLIFAIALSWLGMKTIAGYSWILFVIAALGNFMAINEAMGMAGAVFIIVLVISMLLQISDISNLKMFMEDFKVPAKAVTDSVRDEITAATDDAERRIEAAKDTVKDVLATSRIMNQNRLTEVERSYAKEIENPDKDN